MTRCIKCNKIVQKTGEEICSSCKLGFTDSYLRRQARERKKEQNDTDVYKFCANPGCSNPNKRDDGRFEKDKMIQSVVRGMVTHFCSKECLEGFEKNLCG